MATDSPTAVHPVLMTCGFLNPIPRSQLKCLKPFKLWKKKGNAKKLFTAILTAAGHAATAATMDCVSRCHPVYGAMRYAMPNRYSEPERVMPVTRLNADAYQVICGR